MSGCCEPSPVPCCGGGTTDSYDYEESPSYVTGLIDTFVGQVPIVSTLATSRDRSVALKARLGFRRSHHRVRPGLYAIGAPDDTSPVLVTANYRLSFDALRHAMHRRDAWVLALDTNGINVWCAAGKGTFGTDELVRRVAEARLAQVVSHANLILPQLGAPGVAAHEVRERCGFRVTYGPVRADDLPAFLDESLTATPEMRRVRFTLADRAALTGVELSRAWDARVLAATGALLALTFAGVVPWVAFGVATLSGLAAVLAGALVVPLALPWIPGRAFSVKGAIAGAAAGAAVVLLFQGTLDPAGQSAVMLGVMALSSFIAMQFTGSSTFTSLSGVLWEMRKAVPVQAAAALAALVAGAVSLLN